MLLLLNHPKDFTNEQWILTRFIVAVLQYCEKTGAWNGIFDRKRFKQQHLNLVSCHLFEEGYKKNLEEKIEEFFLEFPDKEVRRKLLHALNYDLQFSIRFNNPDFAFLACEPQWDKGTRKKITNYFADFYSKYFNKVVKGVKYRVRFKKNYQESNPMYPDVCPACLGRLDIDTAEIDHYFPKSLYPALVVHPNNLVPVCGDCNSTGRKGEKVPTAPLHSTNSSVFNARGCLQKVLIPYVPDRSAYKKIRMKVLGAPGKRRAQVVPLRAFQGTEVGRRIENYVGTYSLNETWSNRLPMVNKRLLMLLVDEFRDSFASGRKITSQTVKDTIWNKVIRFSDHKAYMLENHFIFVNYAIWVHNSITGLEAVYNELLTRLKFETSSVVEIPHFLR